MRATYKVTVEPYKDIFRLMVESHGMKSPAGPRLQRGVPGSGTMFSGVFFANNREDAEKSAKELENYLNTYEQNKTKRRRR